MLEERPSVAALAGSHRQVVDLALEEDGRHGVGTAREASLGKDRYGGGAKQDGKDADPGMGPLRWQQVRSLSAPGKHRESRI